MKIVEGNKLIADENKLLDFAEPHYALDEDHVPTRVHLYSPFIKLSRYDKPENYVEINKDEAI